MDIRNVRAKILVLVSEGLIKEATELAYSTIYNPNKSNFVTETIDNYPVVVKTELSKIDIMQYIGDEYNVSGDALIKSVLMDSLKTHIYDILTQESLFLYFTKHPEYAERLAQKEKLEPTGGFLIESLITKIKRQPDANVRTLIKECQEEEKLWRLALKIFADKDKTISVLEEITGEDFGCIIFLSKKISE